MRRQTRMGEGLVPGCLTLAQMTGGNSDDDIISVVLSAGNRIRIFKCIKATCLRLPKCI
jgi:hypothetical protein